MPPAHATIHHLPSARDLVTLHHRLERDLRLRHGHRACYSIIQVCEAGARLALPRDRMRFALAAFTTKPAFDTHYHKCGERHDWHALRRAMGLGALGAVAGTAVATSPGLGERLTDLGGQLVDSIPFGDIVADVAVESLSRVGDLLT